MNEASTAALWLGSLELVGALVFASAGLLDMCARGRSAAVRRQIWALAIAVALVLPLPRLALVTSESRLPGALAVGLLAAWASGTAWLLARLVRGQVLARRRVRRATSIAAGPWRETAGELAAGPRVELRACGSARTPMVVGWLRPVVLVPTGMLAAPPAERRALLAHELAHVARADGLLLLAGGLARALYWPNPLAWWALRRLRAHAEDAADDAALHTGIPCSSYAAQLVAVARAQLERAGRVAADGLRARVRGVLDVRRIRSGAPGPLGWGVPRLVGAALVLATMVTACEARSAERSEVAAVNGAVNAAPSG
ncbi:M56 family metallopeptidase [Nannocystis punicea]|uniref:M56 family metallopeptidase n=1 Tax=Nannocystis punicea TaxID=2995304 RepID=A0ABY7GSH1_9BACT|nr:M56 family metallopeptidase [Nannocystis poenicansa]WAS89887.1 M56 family metallopeptidase [Nannocystis poenicansa]